MKLPGFIRLPVDTTMTFSSFIEGGSNSFAKVSAIAATEKPGEGHNPFYIYGSRGTGKSHILNAMANELADKKVEISICRPGAGVDEFPEFDNWPEALFIDDMKFSASAVEDKLIDFVDGGGQLVISGPSPPEKLLDSPLTDLMRNEGKSADIGNPEEELRIAILKARADAENIDLPDDAAKFIASNIKDNIKSLIGGFHRVKAHSTLAGQAISRFSAIEALKEFIWYE